MDFGNKLQTGCSLADGGVSPRKTLYFICIKGSRSARSGPEIETLFYSSGTKLLKANSSFLLQLGPITKKFGLKHAVLEMRLDLPCETKHLVFVPWQTSGRQKASASGFSFAGGCKHMAKMLFPEVC